jgi:hypothetical protein
MPATVIVTGLAQIQRDLAKSAPAVSNALRAGLREAAEPIARTAETLSLERIPRMGRSPEWAQTKIGVTQRAVYIVPRQRGVRTRNPRRRPNLATLMLGRSFEPAAALGERLALASVTAAIQEAIR